ILRADPDVVLIGEIRDRPTAITAVEAALTGHLVLSTLHTNDAPSAFTRLIEMGVEPFLVASSLECVIAQRLARRLCEWCKEAYEVDEEMLAGMRWPADVPVPEALFRAVGCRSCANTGYRGRLGLHEVMAVSDSVARLAARQGTTQDILEQARADGMQTCAATARSRPRRA
ncbi:MAG: type secretion system protein, partial [Jatrophihabitantaceae bacterium]|nr:type secretion system protein [Jatrophihabitantaceae bacterium]